MGNRYRLVYCNFDDRFVKEYQTRWLIIAVGKFLSLRGEYDLVSLNYMASD